MPMNETWYEVIGPEVRLTQGDLIVDCPLLAWDAAALPASGEEANALRGAARTLRADVVVMAQACDLEHDKVRNVVLCPHLPPLAISCGMGGSAATSRPEPDGQGVAQHLLRHCGRLRLEPDISQPISRER